MLNLLIASHPVPRRSPGGFAASLALHGALIAGAVVATADAHLRVSPGKSPVVAPVYAPPGHVLPVRTEPVAPVTPAIGRPNVVNVPIDVPVGLPPVSPLRAIINTDDPAIFRVGAPTGPGTPGIVPIESTTVFDVEQVEVPAAIDPSSTLPRFPQLLKDAGVEGVARAQFVVDTLGRVEPGTVKIVSATHPLFAAAVQSALPRLRLTPARVGDRKVRQLVEAPFQFRLTR